MAKHFPGFTWRALRCRPAVTTAGAKHRGPAVPTQVLVALVALLILPGFVFASPDDVGLDTPGEAIVGIWRGQRASQPGWDLVFEVTEATDGSLQGLGFWLEQGGLNSAFPLDEVALDASDGTVRLRYGAVVLAASLNATGDILTGALEYGEQSEPLAMERVSLEQVPGLYPRLPVAGERYVYAYEPPADTGDGWDVSTLEAEGFDAATMEALVQAVADGEFALIHSLVVVRNGRLVMDEYFYGYTSEVPHALQSATKSVTSLLVGLAYDQGLISGVNVLILDFLPEHADAAGEGWEGVTLEHVLTMTVGAEWPADGWRNAFYGADDRFAAALEHPIVHEPGTQFAYVSPNVDLLAGVIRHATGAHCDEFAAEHLFGPLGIDTYDWDNLRWRGYPLCDGSLRLRSRDMAKLGQMMLDGGAWRGEQVISDEWVTRSLARHAIEEDEEGYGYLWWLTEKDVGGHSVVGYFASGFGSQFIFILPQFDLVVVTTGGNLDNGQHWATGRMIEGYILPALVAGGGLGQ